MPVKKKRTKRAGVRKGTVKRKPVNKRLTRRPVTAKRAKKQAVKKVSGPVKPSAEVFGIVTHYFPKVNAAVVKLKRELSVGQRVKIKGHTTDFIQKINSMQIDHVPVNAAKKGQEIGLLVDSRVRQHDVVYKVK